MKKCKNCNMEIPESSKFCMHCGKKVEVELSCLKCGFGGLPQDANYCPKCGNPLRDSISSKTS